MLNSIGSTIGKLALVATLVTAPIAAQAASTTAAVFSTASVSVMASALSAGGDQPGDSSEIFYLPAYSVAGVIVGVAGAGVSTVILLETAIDGVDQVLKLTINGVKSGSLAVGNTLQAVATQAGHVLLSNGEYLAFAPNETGRKLLYSEALGK